jgi:hypothetical protein
MTKLMNSANPQNMEWHAAGSEPRNRRAAIVPPNQTRFNGKMRMRGTNDMHIDVVNATKAVQNINSEIDNLAFNISPRWRGRTPRIFGVKKIECRAEISTWFLFLGFDNTG